MGVKTLLIHVISKVVGDLWILLFLLKCERVTEKKEKNLNWYISKETRVVIGVTVFEGNWR
jgi:hypothetical protein